MVKVPAGIRTNGIDAPLGNEIMDTRESVDAGGEEGGGDPGSEGEYTRRRPTAV